jgi:hypothetical protein
LIFSIHLLEFDLVVIELQFVFSFF